MSERPQRHRIREGAHAGEGAGGAGRGHGAAWPHPPLADLQRRHDRVCLTRLQAAP